MTDRRTANRVSKLARRVSVMEKEYVRMRTALLTVEGIMRRIAEHIPDPAPPTPVEQQFADLLALARPDAEELLDTPIEPPPAPAAPDIQPAAHLLTTADYAAYMSHPLTCDCEVCQRIYEQDAPPPR